MPLSFDDSVINHEIVCLIVWSSRTVRSCTVRIDCERREPNLSTSYQKMTLHGCCERPSLLVITDGVMHSRVFFEVIQRSFRDVVDHGLERVDGRGVHGDG
jgi:hypothetical protein